MAALKCCIIKILHHRTAAASIIAGIAGGKRPFTGHCLIQGLPDEKSDLKLIKVKYILILEASLSLPESHNIDQHDLCLAELLASLQSIKSKALLLILQ